MTIGSHIDRRVGDVFKALADPSRRKLLDRLFKKDGQTLTELCARSSMTRFGVMKHLRVLEEAGLVITRKQGREKLHFLNPMPIRLVHDRWVNKYREPLAAALSDLKSVLENPMAEKQIYEVFIRTTPEKLWQAITDPVISTRFFFGESARSDWKVGSEWHSVGPKETRDVEGKVLESDPPRRLVITWHVLYDPTLADELSTVTYLIEKRGALCKFTVEHEVAKAPLTAKHVGTEGWVVVLSALKTLLETGEAMPMPEQHS